jgi:peptide/nickel transport system substrate-binding protein
MNVTRLYRFPEGDMSNRIDRRSFLVRGAATGAGVIVLGVSGGVLDACGSATGSGPAGGGPHPNGMSSAVPRTGGKLTFGVEAEEKGFDPTTATFDTTGILYARTVFDPLAAIAADGSVQPYLAASITPNADHTVWTVVMPPNLRFHDDTPCDAAAVAYNFNAHKHSLLTGPAVANIRAIAVTDPLTVTLTMHTRWVPFDYYLTGGIGGQVAYMASPGMLKDTNNGAMNPVGTGPFVFGEWIQNDHFTAHRNPHYWRPGLPYLDTIEYRPITDSTSLLNSLKSKSVDIIHSSTAEVIKALRGDPRLGYIDDASHLVGEPDLNCLLLNLSKPPFDNPLVRQAAAMSVDSAQYARIIDLGISPAANGPFVKGSPYFSANGYPASNVEKAKKLIQEVSRSTGKPVVATINHVPDSAATKIAQYLQAQFIAVGMQVSLSPVQQDELINAALGGSFESQVWRQFGAVDPDLNYIFWSPTQINSVFSINMTRNNDPAMEVALQKGRQSSDPAVRAAAYQDVASLMGKDIPYIWTDRTVWSIGAQPGVQNFDNPTLPSGAGAFGMISGAVWPTQIWMGT